MKKRIIAILLALSIFCLSLSRTEQRAYADPVTVTAFVGSVLIAAFSVLVCATAAPGTSISGYGGEFSGGGGEAFFDADEFYTVLQDGVVDSSGDIVYQNNVNMLTQLGSLAKAFQSAFDKGELVVEDNNYIIKSGKLNELIAKANQSISVMARPKVDFTAGYNCTFLDVDLSRPIDFKNLPLFSEFFATSSGQAYAPVYFDESRIVFSQYFLYMKGATMSPDANGRREVSPYLLLDSYNRKSLSPGGQTSYGTLDNFYNYKVILNMSSFSNLGYSYVNVSGSQSVYENPVDHCFVYENGTVTYTPISDVDVSGMSSGLVTTTGNYGDFIKSIDDYSISIEESPKLDDLSGVVPDDATLSIPVNPDKDIPIANQVGVSIPGIGDTTLAELQGDLNLDINIPSGIITKFPFCIPFDFARFLGILCADPVAPVFRIPISTHPDNLEQWEGNQTIGDYIDPDSPPLFDIDEEIVIDLSVIPLVQPICYTCFIVGFIFLLLHITPKMIQH